MANHPPVIAMKIANFHSSCVASARTWAIPAKAGDDADNPVYIFTEPRVGYRMPRGEAPEEG